MALWKNKSIEFIIFCCCCIFALAVPIYSKEEASGNLVPQGFPGWAHQFEGMPLKPLPLTYKETDYLKDFPGQVGKFSDGKREIIIRWVTHATRLLHPAYDCFKGLGYSITPQPVMLNKNQTKMGCFTASKGERSFLVCEYIQDLQGKSWPDVQSWYWDAFLGKSKGGWWSYVIATKTL